MVDIYKKTTKMEFGLIKSKIEKRLSSSYLNESLKNDLFIFNELVLKNKDVSKLFSLYSDLAENRGYDNSFAAEFIKESVDRIKNIKPTKKSITEINMWLSTTKTNNEYKDIDNLVSENNISIEDKLNSKNRILECLKSKNITSTEIKKLPISEIVDIANNTIKSYLKTLNESDRNKVERILKEDDSKLSLRYDIIKEDVIDKLNSLKETSEEDVVGRINETLDKLNSENYSKVNYIKLKELNSSL